MPVATPLERIEIAKPQLLKSRWGDTGMVRPQEQLVITGVGQLRGRAPRFLAAIRHMTRVKGAVADRPPFFSRRERSRRVVIVSPTTITL